MNSTNRVDQPNENSLFYEIPIYRTTRSRVLGLSNTASTSAAPGATVMIDFSILIERMARNLSKTVVWL